MQKIFAVMAALFFIVMTGCLSSDGGVGISSSTSQPVENDSISSEIGTSGGELNTPSGDASLDVPAGSLSNPKKITIVMSTENTPPGNLIGAYDFTPQKGSSS